LQVLSRAPTTVEKHPLTQINHNEAISLIEIASNEVIITVGLDKYLKVWNVTNDEPKLTFSCLLKKEPI
jgi:WD40 repeat protein